MELFISFELGVVFLARLHLPQIAEEHPDHMQIVIQCAEDPKVKILATTDKLQPCLNREEFFSDKFSSFEYKTQSDPKL